MICLQDNPLLLSLRKELEQLTDYFSKTLSELKIVGAVLFGSVVRGEKEFNKITSDIDVVAYSSIFNRESSNQCIDIINSYGGNFSDKAPIFLEDFISPRIEYFYKINGVNFDINIFPLELGGYTKRWTNAIHDSLEIVIGAMYEKAVLLFGNIPFESQLKKEFFPFYSDELRIERMRQLYNRIISGIEKIEANLSFGADDLLYQVFKTRKYLIKWLFIKNRKYPVDIERYLEKQLKDVLKISEDDVNSILLRGSNLIDSYRSFTSTVRKLIQRNDS